MTSRSARSARSAIWLCAGLLIWSLACWGGDLQISEIAWAGTAASSSDEWIELQNVGDTPVDLLGWQLTFGSVVIPLGDVGEATVEARTQILGVGDFLLLERTDDRGIIDVMADVIYRGSMSNSGVIMELWDPSGNVVDAVYPGEDGWVAGTAGSADVPYCTMVRTLSGEWVDHTGEVCNGLDGDGVPVNGTPGQPNELGTLASWSPEVTLLYPAEEDLILSGVEQIRWEASDPDGADDALQITIYYRYGQIGWRTLIDGLANTGEFTWATTDLPASADYSLVIRAIDPDYHRGEAFSPQFEIAN